MALRLILGNSGSGKTNTLYGQIVELAAKHPRKNYLCLVPEQYTMQTQKKLVELSKNHAIMNIDVLSFKRLAYRVFDELGVGNLQILEETGKNLVLRKIAQNEAEHLTVLKGNLHRMGYISEVKSFLSELMQYNVSPEELKETIETEDLSPALKKKLCDLHVIYEGFSKYLQGNYITAEELLHVLSRVAPESKILKDSVLVFDEFTGFTPVQIELLRNLMPLCEDVWVTLTIDAKEDFYHSKGKHELFDMPKKTIRVLMDLAGETNTEVAEPIVLSDGDKKRFCNAPALYFMEQNLFRSTGRSFPAETDEITIYSMKNPKDELIWTARMINQLVHSGAYRYRDIAVVSGNMELYGNYLDRICKKYEIPYFKDATKEVLFHPFIEFIRSVLEVVRTDFSYNSVMRLLRTGYTGFASEEIDKLENYLLATGIRGKNMWDKRWLRLPRNEKGYDLEHLEGIRDAFMIQFAPLLSVFAEKNTVAKQIQVLTEYMKGLSVEEKLLEKEAELLRNGEQAKAKEYGQIYAIVSDLFEKCTQVLGEEELSVTELAEILDSGFEAAQVAVIPPGYDSVTFGDIERTRLNHVKVLLFIGVNEGVVPKAANKGGLISEFEREVLEEARMELAPGTREQAFIQKYYLYLNMTKPSDKLILSYSRVDSEGAAMRPSYLIRTMLRLFPSLPVQEKEEADSVLNASTKQAAKDYFLSGERDEDWFALAKCFMEDASPEVREEAGKLFDAFYHRYQHDPISRVVAEALYGKKIKGSVSRLETYARCAYAHFLSYGLKLQEREENGFESVDEGNLYHAAIERYSKKLAESPFDWFTVPEDVRDDYAKQSMEEAIMAYPNLSVYASAESAHKTQRLNEIFRETVWALTTQVRKGQFVPNHFEVAFYGTDRLQALEFALQDDHALQLRGRIDRMDTYTDEDRVYIKIIDYKTGSTKFDLIKLYRGLQLQLVVYMNAAMELEKKKRASKTILPGAMFYYHIDDPIIPVEGECTEEEIRQSILRSLRPDGMVNAKEQAYRAMDMDFIQESDVIPVKLNKDGSVSAYSQVMTEEEYDVISEYVRNHIIETGNAIYEGNIEVAPYADGQNSGCAYCPYRSVCGFDLRVNGFRERRPAKMAKKEVLEKMQTENAMHRGKKVTDEMD